MTATSDASSTPRANHDLPRWYFALPPILAALVHLVTLANGFVFDDYEAIRSNPVVQGSFAFGALLRHDFWGRAPGTLGSVGTWRPLALLTLWIDRHAGGGGPFAFHLSNLLFHVGAVTALTLAFARRLRSPAIGVTAGAIFAVMAIGTEGVASIVARADVLAAAFSFAAFAAFPSDPTERARPVHIALTSASMLAALLCKEAAIATPAVLVVCEWALTRSDSSRHTRRQRLIALTLASAAAIALYLALRLPLFGGVSSLGRSYNNNPLIGAGIGARLLTSARLLGLSLQLALFPLQLAPDYSFAEIMPSRSLFDSGVLAGLALFLALVLATVGAARVAPRAFVAIAWFALPYLAVSNLFVLLPTIFAERLLYAPSAGIALLLASGIDTLRARDRRPMANVVLVLLLFANAARSVLRDIDWHDARSLFGQAVIDTPRCARSWENLGAALMEAHRPREALHALTTAVEIAPDWGVPYALLGGVLDELGDPVRAERALRRSIRLDPALASGYTNLTVFLVRHGRRDDALATVRAGRRVRPADAGLTRLEGQLEREAPRP